MLSITLTVKNFPSALRNRIRAEALLRSISMGEMLATICNEWLVQHGNTSAQRNLDDDN